ncbi:methionyl-tRNA formyltransferase [Ancylobacter dichloromethanicus]|uniref:Methionyl-tRNA formyltransferase n=1 Tax=Ancylobacter dichloromethanicus TaxID=518825 RepID=A0A9W6JAH8_9HYPH|nr:methionyl-tRNA formyltransferase [Ancylobacter dichloromethanicus]MBS7555080.1 methionyl-tRNA formyltransferase [Ancylobacter dichloromethanicus]GLK72289.1 methionyl-tRNA formyltransferase [Ancylobacter dichloromethanicus]
MRIVFMGTPDFAVPTLVEIVGAGHEVVAAYTRAPAPAGRRGLDLVPSPVHRAAERLGIPVLTPATLRTEDATRSFAAHEADAAVVVAYGRLLPQAILDLPTLGCLNLHASLLPRWRGAAPIQRAIMAGDAETGVAVMKMEAGLDTGPVGLVERVAIGPDMTAGELHDRLMIVGGDLMGRALAALERGALSFTPQPDAGVTYAAKIDKAETRIDWAMPARAVHDHIRGLSPFPGAWFDLAGARVKVLRATRAEGAGAPGTVLDGVLTIACGAGEGAGAVRLIEVQKAGSRAMAAEEFLRGSDLAPGTVLAGAGT